jgi:hypothetical protein
LARYTIDSNRAHRIHQNKPNRATNGALLVRILAADLSKRWFKGWQLFGKPIVVVAN